MERNEVKEFIKTLKPITDFSTLKKGDKIFNRCSLGVDFVDTFERIENWKGEEIIWYTNFYGELWWGETGNYWYYMNEVG